MRPAAVTESATRHVDALPTGAQFAHLALVPDPDDDEAG